MLQPTAAATEAKKWMVNRRTKRAVRVNVTLQPATVTTIDREAFRHIMYSGDIDVDSGTSHAVDYVKNRAPLIEGKVYSGLEMQKRAKATFSTQPKPSKRRREDKRDNNPYFEQNPARSGEPSSLAKALAIRLPVDSSSALPVHLLKQPLSPTAPGPPIFHPKLFSDLNPSDSNDGSSPPVCASDPILGSLAAHHKRVKQVKKRKRKKIKEGQVSVKFPDAQAACLWSYLTLHLTMNHCHLSTHLSPPLFFSHRKCCLLLLVTAPRR